MAQPRKTSSSSFTPRHAGAVFGISALAIYGLTRRFKSENTSGIATGLALATAGGLVAYKTVQSQFTPEEYKARANFLINVPPETAYTFWRNFNNLPRFMTHLKSVRTLDAQRSEWVASGPGDTEVRWSAQVTEDQPNRHIAWESLPDSEVSNSGSVTFEPSPMAGLRAGGTMVTVEVKYSLPLGPLAKAMLTLLGKHPEFMVREDLRRFKAMMEAGETPTTAGQSHGPRGIHGKTEAFLFRETTNTAEPQARESLPRSA
ncbi:MAG TPA: SRPBCC family protein [Acidisarcina sp.]